MFLSVFGHVDTDSTDVYKYVSSSAFVFFSFSLSVSVSEYISISNLHVFEQTRSARSAFNSAMED